MQSSSSADELQAKHPLSGLKRCRPRVLHPSHPQNLRSAAREAVYPELCENSARTVRRLHPGRAAKPSPAMQELRFERLQCVCKSESTHLRQWPRATMNASCQDPRPESRENAMRSFPRRVGTPGVSTSRQTAVLPLSLLLPASVAARLVFDAAGRGHDVLGLTRVLDCPDSIRMRPVISDSFCSFLPGGTARRSASNVKACYT